MSSAPQPVSKTLNILGASATKKVLIVEGPIDLPIYSKWLERLAHPALYTDTIEVIDAGGGGEGGGRNVVMAALAWLRDREGNPGRVFGLVDRDHWDVAAIDHWTKALPQLRVNPDRHALESYFCDPDEIEPAILTINNAWAAQMATLRSKIDQHKDDYVDHWALLTTTDRVKIRMTVQGYPGHFANTIPVPPDPDVRTRFQDWANVIDPTAAFQEYVSLRAHARAASPSEAYRSHVWAKMFFNQVVYPEPNGLQAIAHKSHNDWMIDLAEFSPVVPPDITAILQPLIV